ncbi:acidic fibroblast growth factor intracellular-binding protein isoform X4 [Haemorhous mexicanus]|uniref:acidic fibroblast growth factor intracellular-binding protein isoform X4 n=1 Tax=Haemorhous mexicanus TaxID=30427 RepID=UPI0028BE6EF6|nr:acidic fibroblast growth factor intracellular-binding protein isoform X4 [Haemorhous mexicanus]
MDWGATGTDWEHWGVLGALLVQRDWGEWGFPSHFWDFLTVFGVSPLFPPHFWGSPPFLGFPPHFWVPPISGSPHLWDPPGTTPSTRRWPGSCWARNSPRAPRRSWTRSAPAPGWGSAAAAARDYAAIVFFANSRFETGKRRLQFLSFGDFAACAQSMMGHWSQGALAPEAAEPDGDLPKSFLQDLKELKVLVSDKDLLDQHKSLVCSALRGKISVYNELEANFKALSRALVNVGGKLTHARDVRDFFVDLVEKVIEPCRSDKWSLGDLRLFLTHYTAAPRNLPGFRHQALWERYMAAITACLLRMYHD